MPNKLEPNLHVTLEGNKGGSYVRLTTTEVDEVFEIEVGHDCVTAVKAQRISGFALAAILTRAHQIGFGQMLKDLYGGDEPPKWAEPY